MTQPADTGTAARPATAGSSALAVPDELHRWRCGGCGNMTRFDVVREAKTREFWHLDLAGGSTEEDTDTVSERIASVACRWCGRDDAIEVVERPGARPGADHGIELSVDQGVSQGVDPGGSQGVDPGVGQRVDRGAGSG